MKLPTLLLAAGALLAGTAARGEDATGSFEKDRAAILQMAGDFEVTFHFQETLSLRKGYDIKPTAYDETAHETVKVAEDTGKKIVLQHLLQVEGHVVKHWSQVWTYEDTDIFEFKGQRTWATRSLTKEAAKGGWTQRVTEVTDEPRYEGFGRWIHHEGSSEWTSDLSNRPLPRREYTERNDYDLLIVTNRHTVTPQGWYHEQDNVKQVQRDEASYPLCREVGFNTYKRVTDFDFTLANEYWSKTGTFWASVRSAWDASVAGAAKVGIQPKVEEKSLSKLINELAGKASKGTAVTPDEITATLKPFIVLSPK